jgi:putative transposase
MRRARWLAAWRHSQSKPVIYHCLSRVVDKQFVIGPAQKERFRMLMRCYEKFSGCRVLSYCLMDNHFHLLLEVPPMPEGGFSDEELLTRLRAIYTEAQVAEVAAEIEAARQLAAKAGGPNGELTGGPGAEAWLAARLAQIHERYTYRMHSLAEFMKGLLQRYTSWHNRTHERSGRLWEDRFKSVIVEDGVAARTIAAYIDLNPVRAGLVEDPADYRWSSYGEAIGGGPKGNGKTARAGLVRALRAHQGAPADDSLWAGDVSREYRRLLMAGAVERSEERINEQGQRERRVTRKGIKAGAIGNNASAVAGSSSAVSGSRDDGDIAHSKALRCRIRYFTDGVVLGSRSFVNEAFLHGRDRFGPRRKDGARKLRGSASALAGAVWNMRDLRKGVV